MWKTCLLGIALLVAAITGRQAGAQVAPPATRPVLRTWTAHDGRQMTGILLGFGIEQFMVSRERGKILVTFSDANGNPKTPAEYSKLKSDDKLVVDAVVQANGVGQLAQAVVLRWPSQRRLFANPVASFVTTKNAQATTVSLYFLAPADRAVLMPGYLAWAEQLRRQAAEAEEKAKEDKAKRQAQAQLADLIRRANHSPRGECPYCGGPLSPTGSSEGAMQRYRCSQGHEVTK